MIRTTQEVGEMALKHYGKAHQLMKAVEECNELANALLHHIDNRAEDPEVITEIADICIMAEQLKQIFGNAIVTDEICRKESRLIKRIKDESNI